MEAKPSYLMLWNSRSSLTGFGHISLELPNECYISFWPKRGTESCDIKNASCSAEWYSSYQEESNVNGSPTALPILGLNVTEIKRWWEQFISEKPMYHLKDQNCAVVVYRALCQGSPWFEAHTAECEGIKTPKRVYQYVKDGYNKKKKVGCGSSCKHCLSLYPYLGFGCLSKYGYKLFHALLYVLTTLRNVFPWSAEDKNVSTGKAESPTNADEIPDESIMDALCCQNLREPLDSAGASQAAGSVDFSDFRDLHSNSDRTVSLLVGKVICQPSPEENNRINLAVSGYQSERHRPLSQRVGMDR